MLRANGGWRMADGGWQMADGGWQLHVKSQPILLHFANVVLCHCEFML